MAPLQRQTGKSSNHYLLKQDSSGTDERFLGIYNPFDGYRRQAIQLLFGLGSSHAQDWLGILVIFSRLEMEYKVLLRDEFNVIWKILGREKPTEVGECWQWCLAVLLKFQSLQANEGVSMENVYEHLISDRSIQLTAPERNCS